MDNIDIIAKLSDMKIVDYKNTLALVSLIEDSSRKGNNSKRRYSVKSCRD